MVAQVRVLHKTEAWDGVMEGHLFARQSSILTWAENARVSESSKQQCPLP